MTSYGLIGEGNNRSLINPNALFLPGQQQAFHNFALTGKRLEKVLEAIKQASFDGRTVHDYAYLLWNIRSALQGNFARIQSASGCCFPFFRKGPIKKCASKFRALKADVQLTPALEAKITTFVSAFGFNIGFSKEGNPHEALFRLLAKQPITREQWEKHLVSYVGRETFDYVKMEDAALVFELFLVQFDFSLERTRAASEMIAVIKEEGNGDQCLSNIRENLVESISNLLDVERDFHADLEARHHRAIVKKDTTDTLLVQLTNEASSVTGAARSDCSRTPTLVETERQVPMIGSKLATFLDVIEGKALQEHQKAARSPTSIASEIFRLSTTTIVTREEWKIYFSLQPGKPGQVMAKLLENFKFLVLSRVEQGKNWLGKGSIVPGNLAKSMQALVDADRDLHLRQIEQYKETRKQLFQFATNIASGGYRIEPTHEEQTHLLHGVQPSSQAFYHLHMLFSGRFKQNAANTVHKIIEALKQRKIDVKVIEQALLFSTQFSKSPIEYSDLVDSIYEATEIAFESMTPEEGARFSENLGNLHVAATKVQKDRDYSREGKNESRRKAEARLRDIYTGCCAEFGIKPNDQDDSFSILGGDKDNSYNLTFGNFGNAPRDEFLLSDDSIVSTTPTRGRKGSWRRGQRGRMSNTSSSVTRLLDGQD